MEEETTPPSLPLRGVAAPIKLRTARLSGLVSEQSLVPSEGPSCCCPDAGVGNRDFIWNVFDPPSVCGVCAF